MKNILKRREISTQLSSVMILVFVLITACNVANRKSETGFGWNTYRQNNMRTAVTPETLPSSLVLKWTYKAPHTPSPVWDLPAEELKRMHSDDTYHLSAANGIAYYGSSVDNKVYALEIATGKVKWVFYTEGPVRFSPTIWNKRIYFGSDDGYVYCLNARNGKEIWKYRPGPKDSKIIGSGRLVSLWPVRTSILVKDNAVYFGAGVFPYDGLYICALNAKNGSVIWKNDDLDDEVYELRYGGISPQSYLLATETKLFVPSGRALPAVFDLQTGKFLYYLSPIGKHGGTWAMVDEGQIVAGVDSHGFPQRVSYDIETGEPIGSRFASFHGIDMTGVENMAYIVTESGIFAIDRIKYPEIQQKIDSLQMLENTYTSQFLPGGFNDLWPYVFKNKDIADSLDVMILKLENMIQEKEALKASLSEWFFPQENLCNIILTGNQAIAGGQDMVIGLDRETGEELWRGEVNGVASGLSVSDQHLIVSTDKGYIYCFTDSEKMQGTKLQTGIRESSVTGSVYPAGKSSELIASTAEQLLSWSGIDKGFCLVLDCGEGELLYELANNSNMTIIGIDKNKKKVEKAKRMLDHAGLYGSRVIAEHWPVSSLPEYFADLVIPGGLITNSRTEFSAEEIFRVLRPGGGKVYYKLAEQVNGSGNKVNPEGIKEEWSGFEVSLQEQEKEDNRWLVINRLPLAGAGGWTHQYADPANTACSDDQLVKSPFTTHWYGSPGPAQVPERHARSTAPLAFGGKLFVQSQDGILAYNAYNGTFLWEREFPGAPRSRAEADGGNMAVNDYGVFIVAGDTCVQMDLETGETIHIYNLPSQWKGKPRRWGFIAVKDNILFGSPGKLLTQEYDYYSRAVFDDSGEWVDSENLRPTDALLEEFYKYRISEDFEAVQQAFQRDGTMWKHIAEFPQVDPGVLGGITRRTMTSDGVFTYNLDTKELLWTYKGEKIAHITMAVGDNEIYITDIAASYNQRKKAIDEKKDYIRKGIWEPYKIDLDFNEADVRLVSALDISTGKKKWENAVDLSGCGGDFTAAAYKNGVLAFFGSYGLHDKWRFPAGELRWQRITTLSTNNGEMIWSRPLNYMVRPLIIGDEIIIEPRKCNLYTGEIITRINPVTGQEVPWEFYRPGHTCAITAGNEHCLFYRSYNAAYYDLKEDKGVTYYGAIRPGCLINLIPGNGLVLFPEASSGCVCSFPLRTSVVLKPAKPEEVEEWSLYINNAPLTPVKHLAINLGAPGDRKDKNGTIWFGYPRQYVASAGAQRRGRQYIGLALALNESIQEGMGFYSYDSKGVTMEGTESPWLFTNGCVGLQRCEIPLINDIFGEEPGIYTVRLGFTAPSTHRRFNVKLQGKVVLENMDVLKEAGAANLPVIKEITGIPVRGDLLLELVPDTADPDVKQAPLINCLEIIREDKPEVSDEGLPEIFTPQEVLRLLTKAGDDLHKGNHTEALHAYHQVFCGTEIKEYKLAALQGMQTIGSRESLLVIKKYCLKLDPIMWNYKEPDQETVDAAMRVLTAVANNIRKEDKELSEKMLKYSLSVSSL